MRVLKVVKSSDPINVKYLVIVQHTKFFLTWVIKYLGDITNYEGHYDWYRVNGRTQVTGYQMNKFLNEAVMHYRRSREE